MDFTNKGASIYHELQAIYARSVDGKLQYIAKDTNRKAYNLWPYIWKDLSAYLETRQLLQLGQYASSSPTWVPPITSQWVQAWLSGGLFDNKDGEGKLKYPTSCLGINESTRSGSKLIIKEFQREGEQQIIGAISLVPDWSSTGMDPNFRDWFTLLVVTETRLQLAAVAPDIDGCKDREHARAVTDVFERTIRNVGSDDQWYQAGRAYFEDQIHFYTARVARIEFCLPAFPCKSSNPDKVAGVSPDQSEVLALKRLVEFADDVERIYPPGVRISIISDGQVFSDCSTFQALNTSSFAELS